MNKIISKVERLIFYIDLVFTFLYRTLTLSTKKSFMFCPGKIYFVACKELRRSSEEEMKESNYTHGRLKSVRKNYKGNPIKELIDLLCEVHDNPSEVFPYKVKAKKNKFESTIHKIENGNYFGNLKVDYHLLDPNGKCAIKYSFSVTGLTWPHDITEEFFSKLLEVVYSGIYNDPEDIEQLKDIVSKLRNIPRSGTPFYCETCKVKFKSLAECIQHMDESGHYDPILEQHPHYEPFIKIKEKWNHTNVK